MTEEFSLLQALLQEGNYAIVIDIILQNLPDLEDLQNLCLVNHTCYNYFRAYVQGKTNYLRQSWLNSKAPYEFRQHLSVGTYPSVVCDNNCVMIVSFQPSIGWSVQCFRSQDLDRPVFVQSLYQVDKEDFPWTQFIGNCSLSKRFLVITPTTAEHEIHLWRRLKSGLSSSHMTIKQQMADRYANLHFEYFIILYRHSLYTLFDAELNLKSVWDYNVYSGEYAERIIVKVVVADKFGILHWEKDILEKSSINLRSYKNKMILKTYLEYINKEGDDNLKINDIIGCTKDLVIIDLSDKHGNGHLDLYNYRTGGVPLKRFDHPHKPQHGWVVHCRSVAPPMLIPSLSLVPFIQYSLCLDLKLLQISQKNPDDLEERPWPIHVESVAYNRSQIFFTDFHNRNLINVISTK